MFLKNQNIHITFIFFILTIVVLYLYFAINDIKKINRDHKKTSNDFTIIINQLKDDLDSVKSQNVNTVNLSQQLLDEINHKNPIIENNKLSITDDDSDTNDDDKLKSILDEIPEDDTESSSSPSEIVNPNKPEYNSIDQEKNSETQNKEGDEETIKSLNNRLDSLKKEKLEVLKEICNNLKISNKGTKESLAQRIFQTENTIYLSGIIKE